MSRARNLSGQAMFRYDSPCSICFHCGDRIARISKHDSPGNPWLHEHNYSARCPGRETVAAPSPRYIADTCPEKRGKFCVWDTQDGPGNYVAKATGFSKDHAEAFAEKLNNPGSVKVTPLTSPLQLAKDFECPTSGNRYENPGKCPDCGDDLFAPDEEFPLEDLLAIENQIDQGRYQ